MNKTKAVLMHLMEKGSITSWEAIQLYGCTRLSAVIWTLRHKYNLDIESIDVEFTDRFGSKASFAKYVLKK